MTFNLSSANAFNLDWSKVLSFGKGLRVEHYDCSQYLSSLQLDQTELNPEPERLPQQLLEKCAAISVRPNAIKDLVDSMTGKLDLPHNNPCFACNIANMNFLFSHVCEKIS